MSPSAAGRLLIAGLVAPTLLADCKWLITAYAREQSQRSRAAMLDLHKPCGSLTESPCSTQSKKHACAHAMNVPQRACNARRLACRRLTQNQWRAASLWTSNAPTFVRWLLRRWPGAGNTGKPSAHFARQPAAAAQRSARSTAWTIANVAPKRASAAPRPALRWLTEQPKRPRRNQEPQDPQPWQELVPVPARGTSAGLGSLIGADCSCKGAFRKHAHGPDAPRRSRRTGPRPRRCGCNSRTRARRLLLARTV